MIEPGYALAPGQLLQACGLITKRERRTVARCLKAEMPYLSEFFEKLEVMAATADDRVATAEAHAEAAERRERDTATEMRRLRLRVAELESGP